MSVDLSLIKYAALIAFALIQIFAIVMVLILRYHFKIFSLPGDRRAKKIARVVTLGTAVMFLASGILVIGS